MSTATTKNLLLRQLETSWSLARLHLAELPDSEALWEPAAAGPRVYEVDGEWIADWPDDESYAAGVPTIAWLQWHIGMWWSLAWVGPLVAAVFAARRSAGRAPPTLPASG